MTLTLTAFADLLSPGSLDFLTLRREWIGVCVERTELIDGAFSRPLVDECLLCRGSPSSTLKLWSRRRLLSSRWTAGSEGLGFSFGRSFSFSLSFDLEVFFEGSEGVPTTSHCSPMPTMTCESACFTMAEGLRTSLNVSVSLIDFEREASFDLVGERSGRLLLDRRGSCASATVGGMTSAAGVANGVGGFTYMDARAKAISSGDDGGNGVTVEAGDVAT